MKSPAAMLVRWVLALAIVFIAGCATNTRAKDPLNDAYWQGRIALKINSTPAQAFSANFELEGDATTGRLSFLSPLGSTVAQLQWDAAGAQLQTNGELQHFDSLQALTLHVTGAALPISSLFEWLRGHEVPTPGWSVNLQDIGTGRITAERLAPDIPATLKIVLDR